MSQQIKKNPIVNAVRSLLSIFKVEFGEATLEDGTLIFWEGELEVGVEVTVEVDGEMNPAPEGSHTTTEGVMIVLDASGVVVEIIEPEVPEEEEETTEEEMSIEPEEEATEETTEEEMSANLTEEEAEIFSELKKKLSNKFSKIDTLEKTIDTQSSIITQYEEKFSILETRIQKLETAPQEEPERKKFDRKSYEPMNGGLPVNPKLNEINKTKSLK